jgi:hypothetical protein
MDLEKLHGCDCRGCLTCTEAQRASEADQHGTLADLVSVQVRVIYVFITFLFSFFVRCQSLERGCFFT